MRQIPIVNRDFVALVDNRDFEKVSAQRWYKCGKYVATSIDRKTVTLHYFIMGEPPIGKEWDHWNQNKLDNRRKNLRPATRSQNKSNSRVQRNNKSGFKGVSWHSKDKIWRSQIRVNKRIVHLGGFHDLVKAAKVYDEAAKKHFGRFACTNFPKRFPRTK